MGLQGGDNPAYNNTPAQRKIAQRKIAKKNSLGERKIRNQWFWPKTTGLSDIVEGL
jgi:hypothetical protein